MHKPARRIAKRFLVWGLMVYCLSITSLRRMLRFAFLENPMVGPFRSSCEGSNKHKERREWFSVNFSLENFVPGLVIGFVLGLLVDLSKPGLSRSRGGSRVVGRQQGTGPSGSGEELKMVLVVRQDLKMGAGKIASQCAHAATGLYAELMLSQRSLLRQWEQCGQAKIVVTCKNQQEMNKLKYTAESIGLPTFIVADAGRTQVIAGSKTVLAIGPGPKGSVDSVTGKLRLL